ncbi:thyrotropin-releasing hormone receptor-like [Tachypleus tridentatus]|uniref:thyrotropin-releasing hormone receptor-like n=1 Tax=Tachypleus tridentatus TaxID=6853 RepID=UPI003FD41393
MTESDVSYDTWICNFTEWTLKLHSMSPEYCDLWQTVETAFNLENETKNETIGSELTHLRFLNLSRFWIQRVFVPIISFVGVVGNLSTIVIMTRRHMRSSTNNYLTGLAIFDMLYLMCILILSISHYPGMTDFHHVNYWRLWPYTILLTDACSNTSVWLTVAFTIERYVAVCHPIKGKVYCTESRARKVVITVAFVCSCLTIPTPFEWTVTEVTDPLTNKTTVQPTFSELGMNILYRNIYYWLCVSLFVFLPLIMLTVFNFFLIKSVHASKDQRKTMTRRRNNRNYSRQERKITIMLIAVVVSFMVCQLPTAVLLVYTTFQPPNPMTRGLGNIFNFLMAINSAGNFILYCLLSQQYRRTFLQIFFPCLKTRLARLHVNFQNTSYSNVNNNVSVSRMTNSIREGTNFCSAGPYNLLRVGFQNSNYSNVNDKISMSREMSNVRVRINFWSKGQCGQRNIHRLHCGFENRVPGSCFNSTGRRNSIYLEKSKITNEESKKCFPFFRHSWRNVTGNKHDLQPEREEHCFQLKSGKHDTFLAKPESVLNYQIHSPV